jgi:hypothetical protein
LYNYYTLIKKGIIKEEGHKRHLPGNIKLTLLYHRTDIFIFCELLSKQIWRGRVRPIGKGDQELEKR